MLVCGRGKVWGDSELVPQSWVADYTSIPGGGAGLLPKCLGRGQILLVTGFILAEYLVGWRVVGRVGRGVVMDLEPCVVGGTKLGLCCPGGHSVTEWLFILSIR